MIEMAMAANDSFSGSSGSGDFVMFLPLLIVFSVWGIFNAFIANRKGQNKILIFFLTLIPFIAFFVSIYLASLTDKDVLKKLNTLDSKT